MRQITPQELVDSEVLSDIFDKLDLELTRRFFNTKLDDVEGLKSLRFMAHAADEVQRFIRAELQAEEMTHNEH